MRSSSSCSSRQSSASRHCRKREQPSNRPPGRENAIKVFETDFYLIATRNRNAGYNRELSMRVAKQPPSLKAYEIAIRCTIKLPAGLFERPALSAKIEVPEAAIPQTEIDMELASNIEDLIQQNLGISMTVGVDDAQTPEE